jgi:hypothetical protein
MIFRIFEQDGMFFPQRKDQGEWSNFPSAFHGEVAFLSRKQASDFLNLLGVEA